MITRTRATLILLPLSIAVVVVAWSCSSFDGGSPSSDFDGGGGTAADGSLPNSGADVNAPPVDGPSEEAGVIDAGPPLIECDGVQCKRDIGEICCVYRDGGGALNWGECTIGGSKGDCIAPMNQTTMAFSECDDKGDCPGDLICCHSFNGSNGTCGIGITGGICVAPDKCPLCNHEDGGTSRIPCDEKKPGNTCPPGFLCKVAPIPNSIVARFYCVK